MQMLAEEVKIDTSFISQRNSQRNSTPDIKGQSSELNPEPSLFFFSCYGTVTC